MGNGKEKGMTGTVSYDEWTWETERWPQPGEMVKILVHNYAKNSYENHVAVSTKDRDGMFKFVHPVNSKYVLAFRNNVVAWRR